MPQGFAPVAEADARILILGTMPSVKSLEEGQYYGHPQNAFWRILFSLWGLPLPDEYAARTAFLLEKKIALWDVVRCCEREGSADANIERPMPNDFVGLSMRCPHLQALFFNSRNAEGLYRRLVRPDPFRTLTKTTLPSTSPARAMPFEKKETLWLPLYAAWEELSPPDGR